MKAINYYIIVEKIKEEPKKVGGLELTESQNSDVRYLKAKVISTGNLVTLLPLVMAVACVALFPTKSEASKVKVIFPAESESLTTYFAVQVVPKVVL